MLPQLIVQPRPVPAVKAETAAYSVIVCALIVKAEVSPAKNAAIAEAIYARTAEIVMIAEQVRVRYAEIIVFHVAVLICAIRATAAWIADTTGIPNAPSAVMSYCR